MKSLRAELAIVGVKSHSSRSKDKHYLMLFTETIYAIWLPRNNKIFIGCVSHPTQVMKDFIFRIVVNYNEIDRSLLIL